MGGMPMGGMGAGTPGQQNQERESQIWVRAEPGTWSEDSEDQTPGVVGRSGATS